MGMVSFSLEPPDAGFPPVPGVTQDEADTGVAGGDAAVIPETPGGVLPPPWLSYAPNPGTYTQLWVPKPLQQQEKK